MKKTMSVIVLCLAPFAAIGAEMGMPSGKPSTNGEVVGVACSKLSEDYYSKTVELEVKEGDTVTRKMNVYTGSRDYVESSGAVKGCRLRNY